MSSLQLPSLPCSPYHLPKERRSDMAHHPTFRKIYCDAVPYLFKKVRHSPRALLISVMVCARPHAPGVFLSLPVSFPDDQMRPAPPTLHLGRPDSPAAPFL